MTAKALRLLRAIIAGHVTIAVLGARTWDDEYAGNVTFLASTGDRLTFFNDCNSVDYTDRIEFADGTAWRHEDGDDALRQLTREEDAQLEQRLQSAARVEMS